VRQARESASATYAFVGAPCCVAFIVKPDLAASRLLYVHTNVASFPVVVMGDAVGRFVEFSSFSSLLALNTCPAAILPFHATFAMALFAFFLAFIHSSVGKLSSSFGSPHRLQIRFSTQSSQTRVFIQLKCWCFSLNADSAFQRKQVLHCKGVPSSTLRPTQSLQYCCLLSRVHFVAQTQV